MYHLLPFTFKHLGTKELIVNEVGDFLCLEAGTITRIVMKKISPDELLYKDLVANWFICENSIPDIVDIYATRLRTKKAFLDNFTTLHIFVLTLRCNQNCIYCQASSKKQDCDFNFDISIEDLDRSVELMFRSPSPHLTMEFQGGEPSLVPHLLKHAIEKAEEFNIIANKKITYVLCTNCVNLTDGILDICSKYNVIISTSLDGPQWLHNQNRGKENSYQNTISGIRKAREKLGQLNVSALMTTAETSLNYPKEIIDEYRNSGFHSIFLRALNPYGLASISENWGNYYGKFVSFYKEALEYIIEINRGGEFFAEEFTALIARKILTPFSTGFVDLQSPAGLINSVVVYNYDGYVYASDESRMLAETGDYTFRMGSVHDKYDDIFYGKKAQEISQIWGLESLAGCSDCAFQSYCGADPVRNYSTQGDAYGYRPSSLFCKKHMAIIEYIFSLVIERKAEVLPIFMNWIVQTRR
jgi:His-Xaa-Ser system radical SAM maturase HxsB